MDQYGTEKGPNTALQDLPRQAHSQHLNCRANSAVLSRTLMSAPLPEHNNVYKEQSYWDQRFGAEESYDWLSTFADIRVLLEPLIRPSHRILLIGCGNSTLSADMYDAGYTNLVNIDYSAVVIDRMRQQHHAARPLMTCTVWCCLSWFCYVWSSIFLPF